MVRQVWLLMVTITLLASTGCGSSGSGLDASQRAQLCAPVRDLLQWYSDNPPFDRDEVDLFSEVDAYTLDAEASDQLAETYDVLADYLPSEEVRGRAQQLADDSRHSADEQRQRVADRVETGQGIGYLGDFTESDDVTGVAEIREYVESNCEVSLPSYFTPGEYYLGE